MDAIVSLVHTVLKKLGWPANDLPDGEMIALSFFSAVGTLVFYYIAFGRRHVKRRAQLSQELQTAIDHVLQLQEKLDILEAEEQRQRQLAEKANKLLNKLNENENKQIRVFMDGAFDMMHYGHMNAFRLGRSLGNYLVVGVNTDASITECKGTAPIMNDEERTAAVTACRWVDEVVKDCPYVMTAEYLSWVVKTYNIDYVVHGDDPCIVDGKDVYQEAKDRGIYRSIPRTEGVSTTDIVGRMLYITRDHHEHIPKSPEMGGLASKSIKKSGSASSLSSQLASAGVGIEDITTNQTTLDAPASPRLGASSQAGQFIRRSNFLTTSRIMRIFASGVVEPSENAKIVYVDGAFDLFHQGHIEFLKAAREFGDYLIVGVHNDDLVNKHRRHNYPILNLNERVLSLLGCRYVDDVLIDAPWEITREMVASLKISVVVAGTISDCEDPSTVKREKYYQVPKELGIFKEVKSTSTLTVGDIVERVLNNEGLYKQKVKKKMAAENDYYSKRYGFEVSQQNSLSSPNQYGSNTPTSTVSPIQL